MRLYAAKVLQFGYEKISLKLLGINLCFLMLF